MNQSILLVDYENIGKVDLGEIPGGVVVPFFFGASQKSVPKEFLKAALNLRERFVPIDIEGQGKNALDFHIAYYLGEYLTRTPECACVILSKDKGFDPLVKHLVLRGFAVRRANTLREAFTGSPAGGRRPPSQNTRPPAGAQARVPATTTPASLAENALQWLAGGAKTRRPRTRKALAAHLYSHFSKKVSESEVHALIDQLAAAGQLGEVNGKITYQF
jgi:PIN domain